MMGYAVLLLHCRNFKGLKNHYPQFADGEVETQTGGGIHVSGLPVRCPLTQAHCHLTNRLFLGDMFQLQSSPACAFIQQGRTPPPRQWKKHGKTDCNSGYVKKTPAVPPAQQFFCNWCHFIERDKRKQSSQKRFWGSACTWEGGK